MLQRKRLFNYLLLAAAAVTSLSGVIIQVGYHIGNPSTLIKTTRTMWGLLYRHWQLIHLTAAFLFLVLSVYHLYKHRKWYKGVIKKRTFSRHKELLLFTLIFALSAVAGLIPWTGSLFVPTSTTRCAIIEIHDKIALLLIVFIYLHIAKRVKHLYLHKPTR